MKAIHINEHTQKYIARTFNGGVVPELEGDSYYTRTYYLVNGDDEPNDIVTAEEFALIRHEAEAIITRPPRK